MPWLVTTSPLVPHALGMLDALIQMSGAPAAAIGAATASLGVSGLVIVLDRRVRRHDATS